MELSTQPDVSKVDDEAERTDVRLNPKQQPPRWRITLTLKVKVTPALKPAFFVHCWTRNDDVTPASQQQARGLRVSVMAKAVSLDPIFNITSIICGATTLALVLGLGAFYLKRGRSTRRESVHKLAGAPGAPAEVEGPSAPHQTASLKSILKPQSSSLDLKGDLGSEIDPTSMTEETSMVEDSSMSDPTSAAGSEMTSQAESELESEGLTD